MQISLKWLNELVNIETVSLDDLIEKLTLGGFEVEEILEVEIDGKKEIALDISSTANRSDSLSVQGISTEISVLLNKSPKISTYSLPLQNWQQRIEDSSRTIPVENYCSMFLAVTVENLNNNNSIPKWIKKKLLSSGISPLNNLLDFQNYILLETGYPFAFYDLDKIYAKSEDSKFTLSVSTAKNNQEFSASNNLQYQLKDSTLLIKANSIPISIAGIIEDKEFTYSESTNSLLIEASIFNAAKIRQQSRSLGLRTDRSARYEKSLKNTYTLESFYRLISLLRISSPNLVYKIHTYIKNSEQELKPIFLRYQTINEILGPVNNNEPSYISSKTVSNYLTRLNFKFSYNHENLIWKVIIPHLRSDDITREIDLIEEIGRLHGFNNFLTTLPTIKSIGKEDNSYQTRKKLTSCFLNLGLNELIHYSLVNEKTFLKNEIELLNPLLADYSSLRVSLLPNLIKTVQENLKQGNILLEGFEYGHVFSGNISESLKEEDHVAGIFGGLKTKLTWSDSSREITWFEAKGKIEQLFKQLNILIYWKAESFTKKDLFHPYRSAEVYSLTGEKLGDFGPIHPILANQLSISFNTYLFEFNIEMIQKQIQNKKLKVYQEYPSYPKITKNLSFIIKQNISFHKLQKAIYLNGTKFLSEIILLDEYRGNSIPEKHTSLCLQLIFQSNQETLQNKDIEVIITDLQSLLTQKFDAILRE